MTEPAAKSTYMDDSVARYGFRIFKWGVYALLAINVYFFLHASDAERGAG
jgi:hypothetical protein